MAIVRREPRVFHPIRFFAGLAFFFGGLFFSFGLQSTVNYMGSSILIILSMKTIGLDVQSLGFIGGLAAAIVGIVLLIMSSSRYVSGSGAATGSDAKRRVLALPKGSAGFRASERRSRTGRPRRRILVYTGILWLAVLLMVFGAYVLFDPSTGTDMVKGNVVEMIYLQLGAIYSLGARFWVGSGTILAGLVALFRFSFKSKCDNSQAVLVNRLDSERRADAARESERCIGIARDCSPEISPSELKSHFDLFARENRIMTRENMAAIETEPASPESIAAVAETKHADEQEAQPAQPVSAFAEPAEETGTEPGTIAPAAGGAGKPTRETNPEMAGESGAGEYGARISELAEKNRELEEKLVELERLLVRQKLEEKGRKRKTR